MKRSNSLSGEAPNPPNNRYKTFAKNYQKVENAFSHSTQKREHKRSLANAGGQILGGSTKNLHEYPKMHSSRSMVPDPSMRNSGLSYTQKLNVPNSSKENPSPYQDLRNAKRDIIQKGIKPNKSSFSAAKKPNGKPFNLPGRDFNRKQPHSTGHFNGGNSDGFTHTSVSTPMQKGKNYKTPKVSDYGSHKDQIDEELTILRRSIQNGKNGFKDLR